MIVSVVNAVIIRRAERRIGDSFVASPSVFLVVDVTGAEIDGLRLGSSFVIGKCSAAGADSVVNQESFDVLRTGIVDKSIVE